MKTALHPENFDARSGNVVNTENQRPMGHNGSPEWTAIKASLSILDFQLLWRQIKMRNLYNIFNFGGGLLKKHFSKSSVKIPAMRQQLKPIFIFPIISQETYVAIEIKVHKQQQ